MTNKKTKNIDDWLEETIMKAIQVGKLYEMLFTDEGKQITANYPKKKLHEMVERCLKRTV